jgi:hypothetical protein
MADHASLTGASLHESKGVAAATAGTVYVADGAGSGSWTTLTSAGATAGMAVNFSYTQNATETSTTTVLPYDDTVPQNTEGTEVITVTHTPKSATNILRIDASVQVASSANLRIVGALFQDAVASALMARATFSGAGSTSQFEMQDLNFSYFVVAASTSARTYKLRVGPGSAGTAYINRESGGGVFGNLSLTTLAVTEFKA